MTEVTALVGPVLVSGPVTEAVVAALVELNPGVRVVDQGSYVRVIAEESCHLEKDCVERHLGRPFLLPDDLERVMCSFSGRLELGRASVTWRRR